MITYSVSMSLDGFVAGRGQSPKHPLGIRGELLHGWMRELAVWRKEAGLEGGVTNASTRVFLGDDEKVGAVIMGRNMFGGGPGPWGTPAWRGWWGEDPPFHLPVFVLTHYRRKPLVCQGGTTFHFVTEGLAAARRLAARAAHGKDVAISGGAGVAKQYLEAGLVDEFMIHLVPVFLGEGVRLFDSSLLSKLRPQQVGVIEAPGVTHLTFRVRRRSPSTHR
ncbi:MAG TPA: dihydrofolate reductase family protein [Thermoplasmata archaeon]|nr:dihydrofolate reductase family protein [Thermoplasmata archaeon]